MRFADDPIITERRKGRFTRFDFCRMHGLRQAHDMIYDCCVRQKKCRSFLLTCFKTLRKSAFYGLICILSLAFNPNVDNNTPNETNLENDSEETKNEEKKGISLYCSVWISPTFTAAAISFMTASFGMYIIYINLVSLSFLQLYLFKIPVY